MLSKRFVFFVFLAAFTAVAAGQEFASRPTLSVRPPATDPSTPPLPVGLFEVPPPPQTVNLTVPTDTPLQIALDQEVRVRKVGQPIHGHLAQPVYSFDHLVLPVGTEVNGHVAAIESLARQKRVFGILNADFTPARKVEVEFNELVMADGRHIPFHSRVAPGSGQVMQLISTKDRGKKKNAAMSAASSKVDEARQQARQQWQMAMNQIKQPGRLHRLEHYAMKQLPIRPQYIEAGTLYSAELQEPLDFGSETVPSEEFASIGTTLPPNALLHALLITPLDSATTQRGTEVDAVLSQPLFDGDRLILPQGSHLKGTVLEVRPARYMHHNGQLRIAFREITPPDGVSQRIVSSLESVETGKDDHVTLDSEGGAEAASPKTRYLSTAISLSMALTSFHQDQDPREVAQSQNGVGGGVVAFRLVGMILGMAVKSQAFGMGMGAYGASRSVWSHFIARGQEIVFPRNTVMEIGIGSVGKRALSSSQHQAPATLPQP